MCERYHRRFDFDRTLYHVGDIVRLAGDDNAYKITKVCVDHEKKAVAAGLRVAVGAFLNGLVKPVSFVPRRLPVTAPEWSTSGWKKAAKDLRVKLNDMGILSSFRLQWNQSKLKVNITIECV